jgi:hypothetical protein
LGINEFWVRRISTVSGKDAVTMVEPLFEQPRSDGRNLPNRCETGGLAVASCGCARRHLPRGHFPWRPSPLEVSDGIVTYGKDITL